MLFAFAWQIWTGTPDIAVTIAVTICLAVMFALCLVAPLVEKFLEKGGDILCKHLEIQNEKSRQINKGQTNKQEILDFLENTIKESENLKQLYGSSLEENRLMAIQRDFYHTFICLTYFQLFWVNELAKREKTEETFKDEIKNSFYNRARQYNSFGLYYQTFNQFLRLLYTAQLIKEEGEKISLTDKGKFFIEFIQCYTKLDINWKLSDYL